MEKLASLDYHEISINDLTSYASVMLTGAKSLSTRFRPEIGCIQSWNSRRGWQCPVIIDNMMNLEFLMWAFKKSGDSSYYKI